jgi:hypothetical protein
MIRRARITAADKPARDKFRVRVKRNPSPNAANARLSPLEIIATSIGPPTVSTPKDIFLLREVRFTNDSEMYAQHPLARTEQRLRYY